MYGYGEPCHRCGKDANCKIMSMYSKAMICMDCKDAEKKRPDYKQAEVQDLNEYADRLDGHGMTGSADSVRKVAKSLVEES